MENIAELATALCAAQAEMRPAPKDSVNPHFKSRYADLASLWDTIREPLTKNGLSVVQTFNPDHNDGELMLTTILMHKSGQSIQSTMRMPLPKRDPQGLGSATSYARRYALSAMVGATSDDDDDGNAAMPSNGNGRKPAPAPAPKPSAPTEEQQKTAIVTEIWQLCQQQGMDKEAMLDTMGLHLSRDITGSADLSLADAKSFLEVVKNAKSA